MTKEQAIEEAIKTIKDTFNLTFRVEIVEGDGASLQPDMLLRIGKIFLSNLNEEEVKSVVIHESFHQIFPDLDETEEFKLKDKGDIAPYYLKEILTWNRVKSIYPKLSLTVNTLIKKLIPQEYTTLPSTSPVKIDLRSEIKKIFNQLPKGIDKKKITDNFSKTLTSQDIEKIIDDLTVTGWKQEEKQHYFSEIKPTITFFMKNIADNNLFTRLTELIKSMVEEGLGDTSISELTDEQISFVRRLSLILNRYWNIFGFFNVLTQKNDVNIEGKMYILINLYKSITELIPKLFYEITLSIANKNLDPKDKENYIRKITEDKLTLGQLVWIINKFEQNISQTDKKLSNLLESYIDINLRNKIAHESYYIEDRVFYSFDCKIILSDNQLIEKLVKALFIFTAIYNLMYQKETLEVIKKNPDKFKL